MVLGGYGLWWTGGGGYPFDGILWWNGGGSWSWYELNGFFLVFFFGFVIWFCVFFFVCDFGVGGCGCEWWWLW